MSFDVNAFLNSNLAEPVSDKAPQVPLGRWLARVAPLKDGKSVAEGWITWPKEGTNAKSPRLEVPFEVIDQSVQASMGRTTPPIKSQSFFLNIDSAGRLDTKNNAQFGQLLAALKIASSSPAGIFDSLPGAGPLYITVTPDKKDDQYTRITAFENA